MMKTSCPSDSRDSLRMVTPATTPSLVGYQLSVIIAILMRCSNLSTNNNVDTTADALYEELLELLYG